jgi:hypothetical protein
MDPTTLGVLFTAFFGAISTLFWLYVRELQARITEGKQENNEIRQEKNELAAELKAVALKAAESIQAEQDATRKELAELRKTNSLLVETLSNKGVAS